MSRNRHRSGNPANNVPGSRPQDHKPAQGKPRTVTVKGLVLTLDPAKLNDWELMESLYDLQSDPQNNALSVVPFLRGMFSAKDYGRIKNRLRDPETPDARIPAAGRPRPVGGGHAARIRA